MDVRQTDDEAELVGWLHEAVDAGAHVVLNPAAFTHYSYALRDAAAQVTEAGLVLVEVHLSKPAAREAFRRHSVVGAVATGTVAGFGTDSYRLALEAVAARPARPGQAALGEGSRGRQPREPHPNGPTGLAGAPPRSGPRPLLGDRPGLPR